MKPPSSRLPKNGDTPAPSPQTQEILRGLFTNVADTIFARESFLKKLTDPKRDIDAECGYPTKLDVQDYSRLYERGDIAQRVVSILPQESWKKTPEITSNQAGDETPWEKEWKKLYTQHNLFSMMERLDILCGIGRFGIMLLGINDGKTLDQPLEGVGPDGKSVLPADATPPTETTRKLMYVRVFDESCVKVATWDTNVTSPRFDHPLTYNIQFQEASGAQPGFTKAVHWTRVIHLADNRRNSEVYGQPRMELVFNRLYDLRKVLGGAGEMFWKGGFPGYGVEIAPELLKDGVKVTVDKAELKSEFEKYFNQLQRYFVLEGMTVKSLAPQVADPTNHFKMFIVAICVALGVPYRVFMGSEEAQLAGSQDMDAWRDRLTHRIEMFVEPYVVRALIDRLMACGVLRFVPEYFCNWPDLFSLSAEKRAEIAAKLTDALVKYASGGVAEAGVMGPMEFLTYILQLEQDQVEDILTQAAQYLEDSTDDEEDDTPSLDEKAEEAERMAEATARGKARGAGAIATE